MNVSFFSSYRLAGFFAVAATLAWPARADEQVSARYSHSADNALQQGRSPAGTTGVEAFFLDWRSSTPVSEAANVNYGLAWSRYDFSREGPLAVPEKLQELSVRLGASYRLDSRWLLVGSLQPGFYGDFDGVRNEAFNVPVLLLANYLHSRALTWSIGLRADPFADNPVLPIAGVNWRFAPQWEFTVGFPRAGVSYALTPALKLSLGATVQGGSFHVAADPRPVSTTVPPRLDDTHLDYREIRVGLNAEYKFSEAISLTAEAGVITDQKFDYYERGHTLDGDAAAFFTIGLSGRF